MAFYIESLQKPLTAMFSVTDTQSSTRPQRLLNVLRRERILKADKMFWRNSPEKFQVCLLATAL